MLINFVDATNDATRGHLAPLRNVGDSKGTGVEIRGKISDFSPV